MLREVQAEKKKIMPDRNLDLQRNEEYCEL